MILKLFGNNIKDLIIMNECKCLCCAAWQNKSLQIIIFLKKKIKYGFDMLGIAQQRINNTLYVV